MLLAIAIVATLGQGLGNVTIAVGAWLYAGICQTDTRPGAFP